MTLDVEAAGDRALEEVADLARRLAEADDLDELLQRVVDLAAGHLPACDGASVMMLLRGGRITSPAYSSTLAASGDDAQYAADEGPCLESIREQHTVVVDDLAVDDRWPAFASEAVALGIRSMMTFRLFLLDDTIGALNVYARNPRAFPRRSVLLGRVVASHAAVALKAAIAEAGVTAALRSRDMIGQAKGIIMFAERRTPDDAFARLRELSQATNVPVRELAERVVLTGRLPGVEERPPARGYGAPTS
jgi:GAF domain-containing protein